MVDTDKLRQDILDFQSSARPADTNGSAPATVKDINKLINKTATVLNQFVDELEVKH